MRSEFSDDTGFAENQLRWFVVYTNPRCELRAVTGLKRHGIVTFRPVYKLRSSVKARISQNGRRMWVRRPIEVVRALFPRYLFVGLGSGQSHWELRQVEGIASILCSNGVPAEIAAKTVEDLQVGTDMGLFDHSEDEPPLFKAGDDVHIDGNRAKDRIAKVKAVLESEDLAVLTLPLFGRESEVILSLDRLKHAS